MKWFTYLWSATVGRVFASDTSGSRNMAQWLVDWFVGEKSDSGIRVTPRTAMKLAPFWQGVNTIAGDVATLPLILHRREGENKIRWTDHPAYRLLRRKPNRFMTAAVFKETLQAHALKWGNAFAEIERNNRGDAIALWPLLPDRTEPVVVDGVLWYVTQTPSGEKRKLRAENVFHLKGLGFDGIKGYSVIAMARQNLGLALAQEKYANRFFGSGAVPGGVLEHPGKLGEEGVELLRESWADMHEGLDRSHRVAILEEGMKFSPISIPMRDAQWLEARQFGKTDVASWLNLPPHMVNDHSRATFANIEELNRDYLNRCLMRWLVKWQEEADDKLLREREKDADLGFFEFLVAALLRGDLLRRYQAYALAIANRILNPNEVRALENMNAYEGGDEYINPHINPEQHHDDPPGAPTPEEDDRERDAIARFAELVQVEARRVVQAAKSASNFTGWVASFYTRWPASVREVVAEFGGDPEIADRHCDQSREEIMTLLDQVTPAELEQEIQALTAAWHWRAHRLAREVVNSPSIKEAA